MVKTGKVFSAIFIGITVLMLAGSTMPVSDPSKEQEENITTIRLCEGEQITLTASGRNASAFSWFKGNHPIPGDQVSILVSKPGLYRVLSINENNCSSEMSDGIMVEILTIPSLKLDDPVAVCQGETVNLTRFIEPYDPTNMDYEVEDQEGRKLRFEELESADSGGIYTVKAKNKHGECWSSAEKLKVEVSGEAVQALFDYSVGEGDKMIADADVLPNSAVQFRDFSIGEVAEWRWTFGDGNTGNEKNPLHVYEQKGEYKVTLLVKNENGCTSVMEMVIEIHDSYRIMIPNAFTPEGNKNTTFFPKFMGIKSIDLQVFNSWGNLLYHTSDLESSGWDGKVNGILGPNGNYVYKVQFETTDGKTINKTGVFLLFR